MNPKRSSDTLPRPGLVNQVCKEWLVLEDGALAYQLQQQEVTQHLSNNKQRNAIVREDFPQAKQLQQEAEEEAARLALLAEERDRRLAEQLATQISKKNHHKLHAKPLEGDMNEVGLPLPPQHVQPPLPNYYEISVEKEEEEEDWPPPPPPDAELSKEEQERKDMELAARLQEEEELSEELDRKLAIEAQDEELARLLQEKEKQRARRAREKARARRLQASSPSLPPPGLPPHLPPGLPSHLTPGLPSHLPPGLPPHLPPPLISPPYRGNEVPNIAMAIDPTYQRYNTTVPAIGEAGGAVWPAVSSAALSSRLAKHSPASFLKPGAMRRPEEPGRPMRDEPPRHMRSLPSPRRDHK